LAAPEPDARYPSLARQLAELRVHPKDRARFLSTLDALKAAAEADLPPEPRRRALGLLSSASLSFDIEPLEQSFQILTRAALSGPPR
jgi:hypothetical protein